jgi:hypothetical protein
MLENLKNTLVEIRETRALQLSESNKLLTALESGCINEIPAEKITDYFSMELLSEPLSNLKTKNPLPSQSAKQITLEYPSQLVKTKVSSDPLKRERALLTLELPFSTSPKDIAIARCNIYKRITLLENSFKKTGITGISEVTETWLSENDNPHTQRACRAFESDVLIPVLRRYYIENGKRTMISANEIFKDAPLHIIHNFIDNLDKPSSIKDTYRSYAKNFSKFLARHQSKSPPTLLARKQEYLDLYETEKFFETLEQRALKATVIGKFKDLLLCRALFYIPLQSNELFIKNNINSVLASGYRLPESFLKLRDAFGELEDFLPLHLTEDALYTKVNRLGRYTDLQGPLNPTILRRTMTSICRNELCIDSEIMQSLPPR